MLDISPCGAGYCGQLVKSDDQCDRTVLTVALKITLPQARDLTFDGELTLPGLPRVFKARVNVTRQNATSAAKMVIVGDDVEPNFVRRTFPFSAQLARIGDASCRPKTTS